MTDVIVYNKTNYFIIANGVPIRCNYETYVTHTEYTMRITMESIYIYVDDEKVVVAEFSEETLGTPKQINTPFGVYNIILDDNND